MVGILVIKTYIQFVYILFSFVSEVEYMYKIGWGNKKKEKKK